VGLPKRAVDRPQGFGRNLEGVAAWLLSHAESGAQLSPSIRKRRTRAVNWRRAGFGERLKARLCSTPLTGHGRRQPTEWAGRARKIKRPAAAQEVCLEEGLSPRKKASTRLEKGLVWYPQMTIIARSITRSPLFTLEAAAAYCRVLPETFSAAVKAGLFPSPDEGTSGWTVDLIDGAMQQLMTTGFITRAPNRRSEYPWIPYTVVTWRPLSDGRHRPHGFWRHGLERIKIDEPFGSARFMARWFECEREYASRHSPHAAHREEKTEEKLQHGVVPLDAHEIGSTKFLTEEELAARYRNKVSIGTLRNWRAMKRGPPFVRFGRVVLYPSALLDEWDLENLVHIGPRRDRQ
jgi:hypothetical protein